MSQSSSDHSPASPSASGLASSFDPRFDHKMQTSSSGPQAVVDGCSGATRASKHAAFAHFAAAGFLTASPRLRTSNVGTADQRNKANTASQASSSMSQPGGIRQQLSSSLLAGMTAKASGQSLVGKPTLPDKSSKCQTTEHQANVTDSDTETDTFSWDYIKQDPSTSSGRGSTELFLRSRGASVRGSLDYDFDNDMPVMTRRSKDCGERGGTSSTLSGRSFWSEHTGHE